MGVNDIVVVALLFIAVTDTWFGQAILPKMAGRNPALTHETVKKLQKIINISTLLCFTIALIVYITKPLG